MAQRVAILSVLVSVGATGCWLAHTTDIGPGEGSPSPAVQEMDGCSCSEDGDSDPPGCFVADQVCPSSRPYPGGPCEGLLQCTYPPVEGLCDFGCFNGRWVAGGQGCLTRGQVERCDEPSLVTVDGARVELGGVGPAFAPFADQADVLVSHHSDGAFGLFLRARVSGADVGDCLEMKLTVVDETGQTANIDGPVRLHCGETLGIYAELPWPSPAVGTAELDVRLDVTGIGSDAVHLSVVPHPDDPEG